MIAPELLAAAARHARACFPAECCGYLTDDAIVPCRNAQADGEHPTHPERGPETGFVIAGAELLAFARTFDGPRPARVVYHSHPNGRAYFSEVDRDSARSSGYPVRHLVIGVTAAGATEAALFTADGDQLARWVLG